MQPPKVTTNHGFMLSGYIDQEHLQDDANLWAFDGLFGSIFNELNEIKAEMVLGAPFTGKLFLDGGMF